MNDEKMTATERLRQLLDERGVEWKASKAPLPVTSWHGAHGFKFTAMNPYGVTDYLLVQTNTLDEWPHLTPEQAVEATLGRGTCRMELPDLRGPAYTDVYVCSECGGEVMVGTVMGVSDVPKWCPWCGRKVES